MQRTDEKFFEDMIALTGYPEWSELVKDLESQIYHTQANSLEAKTWEEVNEARGFARGLAYIVNLRDTIKQAQKVVHDNATL